MNKEEYAILLLLRMFSLPDGELSHHVNTRVPSAPRYDLRKRNQSQQQQNGILLLIKKFEKLSIHEMNEASLKH